MRLASTFLAIFWLDRAYKRQQVPHALDQGLGGHRI